MRSHLGILIYIKNKLIQLYRNIQNTVESSSFGLYFVALRTSTEMVEALRYKLRKCFVNLEGTEEVYCDNKSVVKNYRLPASVLNKDTTLYANIDLDNPRLLER